MFESFADLLVYDWLQLTAQSRFGAALHFFIYDLLKISFLLVFIIFLMGIINSYFPVDKVKNFLENKKLFGLEYLLASILGAITPFCSCSSIPLFIGFLKGGIPLGVTLSFLITSPLVNEMAVILFLGLFGLKITLIYTVTGILVGTVVGMILGRLGLEKYLEDWLQEQLKEKIENAYQKDRRSFSQRVPEIRQEAWDILKRVFPYLLAGIAIGGLIHGFIPTGYFDRYMSRDNWWAVPFSVLIALPMYSNASGVIPVVQGLMSKGIPLGTSLAFMMAVVGLSFPEAMLLKKVMKIKLIMIYFSIVGLSIIIIGNLYNIFL